MKETIRRLVIGMAVTVIGSLVILFVASVLYELLPALATAIPIGMFAFLISLRDWWWACCVVLAAIGLWAFYDESDLPQFSGPVLRGRSVPRQSTRSGRPRRRSERESSAYGRQAEGQSGAHSGRASTERRRIGPSGGSEFSSRHRRR